MLTIPPSKFRNRKRRPAKEGPFAPPVPVALTLVAASYDPEDDWGLQLTFDRAIDIAGMDGGAILIEDPVVVNRQLSATAGAELVNPSTVRFMLDRLGGATGSVVTLTATADNGIVAVDDGGAWAGVTDLELPFG